MFDVFLFDSVELHGIDGDEGCIDITSEKNSRALKLQHKGMYDICVMCAHL